MTLLRWLLCCTLTAAMVLPAPTAMAAGSFRDDDGTVFEDAIERLVAAELVSGCAADQFCVHAPVRRGEAAAMLSSAFALPPSRRDYFTDDDEHVHEDAINRLAHAGVIEGCEDDRYCIGDQLRRAQMATLIARAADLPAAGDEYFHDGRGSHREAINRLAAAGITAGCAGGGRRFCPDRHVRRGELALFIGRALDLVPRATLREQLEQRRREEAERARREAARRRAARRKAERQRKQAARERKRADERIWDRLAHCESGGNWAINTGNGYYGGLQFSLSSWRGVGGRGYPHHASRAEQIARGRRLQARQGWGAWPSCSRKLGLR